MDDKTFSVLWQNALEYNDQAKYVYAFVSATKVHFDSEAECREYLTKIWHVAHLSVRDMIEEAGYNQSSFARHFCIPLRTVQTWCSNSPKEYRECASWAKLSFARQLNML